MTREGLLNFLETNMGVDITGVNEKTPLFSSGLVDSFSMVDLILFIEKSSGQRMDVLDVSLDNLDTIGSILQYAAAKSTAKT